ncbi:MAG: cobyric acid synthase CobQ [Desulfobacteraceae bacterium 4572_19]|nr:MAG: cobyric acid synthase CobQ [Desulfobacteraceae bacterium 4572_19]
MESKNKKAICIAVLGTGSDVGKSIIATAICRYLKQKGLKVAPYKAQNMSNNSGVTPEGLEMGRAQIVQAEAAGVVPHVDMNPILLKPTSETGAQIVLFGKALENSTAIQYHKKKEYFFQKAKNALDRLRKEYEIIIIEGAGSCAEVNLMPSDIVNFRMAEYAKADVILIADIHKGGVFGQLIGTLECIPEKFANMITGFIINRFKGDITLFETGIEWIEKKSGKKVFGVLPWYNDITIEAEDSVVIETPELKANNTDNLPEIVVIRLPHISNFTDFQPLININAINLVFAEKVKNLSKCSAVIIPGSKNTRFDLDWINKAGWADEIKEYVKSGGHLLGICGGYQMMGSVIHDPEGLEGHPGSTSGLDLLPVETILKAPKTTTLSKFKWDKVVGTGYEIHMGYTTRNKGELSMFNVYKRNKVRCEHYDGCIINDGQIQGTYMHGIFDEPEITKKWLKKTGLDYIKVNYKGGLAQREIEYDRLAKHFEKYINMDKIIQE